MAERQLTFPGMVDEVHNHERSWALRENRLRIALSKVGIHWKSVAAAVARMAHQLSKNNDMPLYRTNAEIADDKQLVHIVGKAVHKDTVSKAVRRLVEIGILRRDIDKTAGRNRANRRLDHARILEICESDIVAEFIPPPARKSRPAKKKSTPTPPPAPPTTEPGETSADGRTVRLMELAAATWQRRLTQVDRRILADVRERLKQGFIEPSDIERALSECDAWIKSRAGPVNHPVSAFERILDRVAEERVCR